MRVLIVDDDVELVGLLEFALQQSGLEVLTAFDGHDALRKAIDGQPSLVVLDVNLPGLDGFEVLERLRRVSAVSVLMLTVRADEVDEVRGFDLGADDYLRKPFSPRALLARIRALLRRGGEASSRDALSAGPLHFDGDKMRASLDGGGDFRVTLLESRLLQLLINQRGRPVDLERLRGYIWSDRDQPDRDALKQLVHRLRQKLAAAGSKGLWIESVPGAGYVLRVEGIDGSHPKMDGIVDKGAE